LTTLGTAAPGRVQGFHPGWYGAVMGTAVVGIVAAQNPGAVPAVADTAHALGVVAVGLAVALAVVLGVPYVARWVRYPADARADFANPVVGGLYGTFPGGLIVLALGIAAVGPSVVSGDVVTAAVAALGISGTLLAFIVSIAFTAQLVLRPSVEAPAINGSWFIPPVVTIVVPVVLVALAPHVAPSDLGGLIALAVAFWGMGIVLFVLVASLFYDRLILHPPLPAPLAPSIWIGIGPAGVGSLALLRIAAAGTPLWGDAAPAVAAASLIGATALWGLGLWWLGAASVILVAHRRRGPLPFGIGWWGFTFPLGAFAAATVGIARGWHAAWLEALGVVLFVALLLTWAAVAARTVRAVRAGSMWAR